MNFAPHAEARWTENAALHSPDYDVYVGEPVTCAPRGAWLQLPGTHGGPQREAECGETPHKHIKHYR